MAGAESAQPHARVGVRCFRLPDLAAHADRWPGHPQSHHYQQTQATLSASYHRSLWAGVPLNLTTDPKSQNYEYVKVQDSASSEIDIGYRDGLLARAQARRTASQSTQVMRYELARLVSDVTTPLSGASNIDLTPLLQTLLRNDAAHSGTSATNAPDDDANATQSEIRKRTRLEIDPSRLNV